MFRLERLFASEKASAVERYYAHRDQIRRGHRQHHRERQCAEQILSDSKEKHDREEDDAGSDSRRENWEGDFLGAFSCGGVRFLAFRQMAIDVLEHNHRVIDQPAYRKREAAKCHDIDSRAIDIEPKPAGQNGKWNRQKNRKGRSEATEKYKNHERGQNRTGYGLMFQTSYRLPDVDGLVENSFQFHPGWKAKDLRKQLLDAIHH